MATGRRRMAVALARATCDAIGLTATVLLKLEGKLTDQVDFQNLGPAIGNRFPDVILPGADGTMVDLHADRAGRPALVVFHRSARW